MSFGPALLFALLFAPVLAQQTCVRSVALKTTHAGMRRQNVLPLILIMFALLKAQLIFAVQLDAANEASCRPV
jgi:hypothetical protein